jgi:hypothetical protein
MKNVLPCFWILIAAVSAFAEGGETGKSTHPFEVTFVKRLPAAEIAPVYDPKLPGYRFDAEIATVKIRPLAGKPPDKLVMLIRTSPGMPPMLEGFTLQAPDRSVTTGLKLASEEIRFNATPGRAEVRAREYFEVNVVGQDVQIVFLPKAMGLLKKECTVTWVDWYRH